MRRSSSRWPPGLRAAHTVAIALAFAFITSLDIVVGELAPKTIALQHAEQTALFVGKPTEVFMFVFWPFIALLERMGARLVRLLGLRPPSGQSLVHSEEELKMLVTASQEAGVLEEDEEQMLHRVFGFGDLTAGQVMVPRTEMVAVPTTPRSRRCCDAVQRRPYPWLPVFRTAPGRHRGRRGRDRSVPALSAPTEPFNLAALPARGADRAGDAEGRRPAERDEAAAARTWRSSSTSTAAPPAW